jgi:hypothetical protein
MQSRLQDARIKEIAARQFLSLRIALYPNLHSSTLCALLVTGDSGTTNHNIHSKGSAYQVGAHTFAFSLLTSVRQGRVSDSSSTLRSSHVDGSKMLNICGMLQDLMTEYNHWCNRDSHSVRTNACVGVEREGSAGR